MATFKKFEEIQAWQKAREITKAVYQVTNDPVFQKILVYEIKFVVPLFQ
ncbi:MAG TPA: hypothetical protein VGO50_14500 [Pyrinomonadaceae bacterium]|jgi:hypothetical protein|nr:hypothetical protein [Pyrinomonadaceae bacterium]